MALFQFHIFEKKFLIISELNDQGTVKGILQPFRELERNQMSQVKSFTRGSSSRVEVELGLRLIQVKDEVEIPMREEDASADEAMTLLPRDLLDARHQRSIQGLAAELDEQLVVVDVALHRPGVHDGFLPAVVQTHVGGLLEDGFLGHELPGVHELRSPHQADHPSRG